MVYISQETEADRIDGQAEFVTSDYEHSLVLQMRSLHRRKSQTRELVSSMYHENKKEYI
jgi:hypothetical protein